MAPREPCFASDSTSDRRAFRSSNNWFGALAMAIGTLGLSAVAVPAAEADATGAVGAGAVDFEVFGATDGGRSREYSGNEKSNRLSLSPERNAILAVIFAGKAIGSIRASKKDPFRASTNGAEASSRVAPVFESKTSLVTTRPRTCFASLGPSGLE